MSKKPALQARTPDDSATNALIDAHDALVHAFEDRGTPNRHIAIVELGVSETGVDEGGDRKTKVYIRHIELASGPNEEKVEKIFTDIHRKRTGNSSRPDALATPPEDEPSEPLPGLDELDR